MEKEIKKEIQELRTKLNLYKKTLKSIHYQIDHLKKEPYDDGDAAETLLYEIKSQICVLNIPN